MIWKKWEVLEFYLDEDVIADKHADDRTVIRSALMQASGSALARCDDGRARPAPRLSSRRGRRTCGVPHGPGAVPGLAMKAGAAASVPRAAQAGAGGRRTRRMRFWRMTATVMHGSRKLRGAPIEAGSLRTQSRERPPIRKAGGLFR
jgi:hypothetical protein